MNSKLETLIVAKSVQDAQDIFVLVHSDCAGATAEQA